MKVRELFLLEKAPLFMASMAHVIADFVVKNMTDIEEMRNNRGSKYDSSGFYQLRIKPTRKDYAFGDVQKDLEKILKSKNAKKLEIKDVVANDLSPNSGKFSSVSFSIGDGKYDIVIAAGGNKGENFEKDLLKKLQDALKEDAEATEDAQQALDALSAVDSDITIDNIKSIDARSGSTKRSGDIKPKQMGEIIADIVITLKDGTKKYISVKNSEGNTIANFGVAKAFNDDLSVNTDSTEWQSWLAPLGLDPDKITEGLRAYDSGKTDLSYEPVEKPNKKFSKTTAVYKLLHKLWGSDYIYLRHKSKKFTAMLVDDSYIHNELLKNLTISEIRYPTPGRKQVTVFMISDGKKYKLELRNSKGATRPTELKFGLA